MRTLRALLLTLVPAIGLAQTITTSSLPNAALNQSYTVQLSCTNCKGYSYVLVNGTGALPPNLNLSRREPSAAPPPPSGPIPLPGD